MKDDRRSYLCASDLANKVLKTPGPGSAIAVDSYNVYSPCPYPQAVERKSPRVRLINPEAVGIPGLEDKDLLFENHTRLQGLASRH